MEMERRLAICGGANGATSFSRNVRGPWSGGMAVTPIRIVTI